MLLLHEEGIYFLRHAYLAATVRQSQGTRCLDATAETWQKATVYCALAGLLHLFCFQVSILGLVQALSAYFLHFVCVMHFQDLATL